MDRSRAWQLGHSVTSVIDRQLAEPLATLLPGRFIPAANQRGHAHIFIPAPTRGTNRSVGSRLNNAVSLSGKPFVALRQKLVHIDAAQLPELVSQHDMARHAVAGHGVHFKVGPHCPSAPLLQTCGTAS